ncbi:MAG TPA: hypothetical protein VHI98_20380 [Vicinamibacterales bacterium]|jgi:cytochrome c556|nr:hypothetical protein [Vicinamibacterales bacterium]
MLWRLKLVAIGAVLALGTGGPSAQSAGLKPVMLDKLEHTQRLLEAVVTADYAAMARRADRLGRFTETEIASWYTEAQAEYTKQATLFVLSVSGLRDAAAAKNLDAAALEYTTLVSSCIGCHRYVERTKASRRQRP